MIIMSNARFEREIEKRMDEQRQRMYLDRRCDELERQLFQLGEELSKLKGEKLEQDRPVCDAKCAPVC